MTPTDARQQADSNAVHLTESSVALKLTPFVCCKAAQKTHRPALKQPT